MSNNIITNRQSDPREAQSGPCASCPRPPRTARARPPSPIRERTPTRNPIRNLATCTLLHIPVPPEIITFHYIKVAWIA